MSDIKTGILGAVLGFLCGAALVISGTTAMMEDIAQRGGFYSNDVHYTVTRTNRP